MKNVNEFLDTVRANKQAEALLKANYNTNEESVAHLLNHRSESYAQGKLEEYRILLETCKFKLVVYWTNDKWGRPFTVPEKKAGENRRPIPSVDLVGRVYDEEQGLNTLINKVLKECSLMDSAQIYLMDRVDRLEHMVYLFDVKQMSRTRFTELEFKTSEQTGARFFSKILDTKALRTDKMRMKP